MTDAYLIKRLKDNHGKPLPLNGAIYSVEKGLKPSAPDGTVAIVKRPTCGSHTAEIICYAPERDFGI